MGGAPSSQGPNAAALARQRFLSQERRKQADLAATRRGGLATVLTPRGDSVLGRGLVTGSAR